MVVSTDTSCYEYSERDINRAGEYTVGWNRFAGGKQKCVVIECMSYVRYVFDSLGFPGPLL